MAPGRRDLAAADARHHLSEVGFRRPRRRVALAAGSAIALFFAVVTLTVSNSVLPVRVLYDGLAPPEPYRWVVPPENAVTRESPASAIGQGTFAPSGSVASSTATPDNQASIIIPAQAIAPAPDENGYEVSILPIDAGTLSGIGKKRVDSNAYTFSIVYAGSREPVKLLRPVTILMRYAVHTTDIGLIVNQAFTPIVSKIVSASQQVFGDASELGTFVAIGDRQQRKEKSNENTVAMLAAAAVLSLGMAQLYRRERGKRSAKTRRAKTSESRLRANQKRR